MGWAKFGRRHRDNTQKWLTDLALRSDDPDYLRQLMVQRLRSSRLVLPAESTLDRMVALARSSAQAKIIASIITPLNARQSEQLDQLRKLKPGSHRTYLQWIKDPVGCASPNSLKDLLARIEHVGKFGICPSGLEAIHPDMRRRMTVTVQVYSVDNLYSDFQADRRRAYLACYLHERLKGLIDLAVEAFDEVVLGMFRRSESERDDDLRKRAPAINEKLHLFSTVAEVVLDESVPDDRVRERVFKCVPRERLSQALSEIDGLVRPEDYNCLDYVNGYNAGKVTNVS